MAFEPSAVSDDTVNLVAGLAECESGNARFAIELLWRAGKYADSEDAGEVLPEFVRRAVSSIIPTMKKAELESLGQHAKLFLLGVARFFEENEKAYASLSEVEKAYAVVCEEFAAEPSSHTMVWKYAQLLSDLGFLKAEVNAVDTRGRATRIFLPSIPARELERELCALLKKEETKQDGD
jgi:cell division control protein 6